MVASGVFILTVTRFDHRFNGHICLFVVISIAIVDSFYTVTYW